jgi:hypothetical protein
MFHLRWINPGKTKRCVKNHATCADLRTATRGAYQIKLGHDGLITPDPLYYTCSTLLNHRLGLASGATSEQYTRSISRMTKSRVLNPPPAPLSSLIFGFGPMAPFVAAGVGAWTMAPPWPALAARLAILWGGIVLVFIAGVRRGYGFGNAAASTTREIATMLVYFTLGALALAFLAIGWLTPALALLILGYILTGIFDRRAARTHDAPPYFALLRPLQCAMAVASLAALSPRLVA